MKKRDTLSHKLDMMYDNIMILKMNLGGFYVAVIFRFSWLITVRRTSKDRSIKGER